MEMEPPPSIPDHSNEQSCKLLGTTGLVVQALMGIFVILSLVVKRQLEKRKRSWRIWVYDVSKQLAGQAVVHGLNILISDLVASAAHNNPCSLYFLNVLIDTTIGVGIIYFSLKLYTWFFSTHMAIEGFTSGQYGHPPKSMFWCKQLVPYLMSIITMKLLVLLPLTLPGISGALIDWSHNLLDHIGPRSQVIVSMAIFPLVMNILQFCLVDQVIKAGKDDDDVNDDEEGEYGISNSGGEYRRVRDHEDLENVLPLPVHPSRDLHHTGKDQIVSSNSRRRSSVMIPSSPLLSPSPNPNRDYGSTTPSPIGSPIKSNINTISTSTNDSSIWSINKVSEVGSSTTSSSTVFFDAQTDLSDPDTEAETETETESDKTNRLYVRNERGQRSLAPSPETLPIQSPDSTSNPNSIGSLRSDIDIIEFPKSGNHDEESRTPSPPSLISGLSRYPREELEREARWTLSPPQSPTVESSRESVDSVHLRKVNKIRDHTHSSK
ncbi:uncharacterized protein IL334_000925 [Kwoniella shivajii]|uniref:Vacuolar membrane protein n=1 Tax=Kwoniella shivajii TaxID=564305 RepID=A0ABZ1CQI5_9TREE|nr:hypothetical protein IL334_000925 [Kwoniella shivajii]